VGSASATILSWITTEVNQALARVRERIARFVAEPEDLSVLAPCAEHLHQVAGALRMVGLAGATAFCEAIEAGFERQEGARPSAATMAVLDRAVQALNEFVDGLERGQANVPLRLWPMYRELRALRADAAPSEKDLFFPDLTLQAPAPAEPRALPPEELRAFVQAQRALFQRGMLALLKQQGGVPEMRQAMDAMHQVSAHSPDACALWWAAGALVDGLEARTDAGWLQSARPVLHRLDLLMRDTAAGAPSAPDLLLREVLYAVAICKPATPRLREVKQLYLLDSLFPEAQPGAGMELDMDWLQPALADVRSRLEALKSMWLQYISGEAKSAPRFRELIADFRAKAAELGNPHLVKLLDAVAVVAARLPDPYEPQNQYMVIEMASAFLLAEGVVESFADPASDLGEQIAIMGGWLLDAADGKSTSGEPPAGLRADLSERIGALQLRAQVAREIASNLKHVEKVLDGFARDAAKRDTLHTLGPYLHQIHGALEVLEFERAAQVIPLCEQWIAACADPAHDDLDAHDMDWIAEGLSSVGFFLDPCLQGRPPQDEAIELFFRRYDKAHAPAAPGKMDSTVVLPAAALKAAGAPEPAPDAAQIAGAAAAALAAPAAQAAAGDAAERRAVDAELLSVFLEEAGDVLAAVDGALPQCRAQPYDRDALTVIRRAFHTLKGSGRMVGLMDLAEVAWELEQVLNRWLEQQWPASAPLLALVEEASGAFADWVGQLRSGGLTREVDAEALVAQARALRAEGLPAEAPAAPSPGTVSEPVVEAEPAPAPAEGEVLDFLLASQPVVREPEAPSAAPEIPAAPEVTTPAAPAPEPEEIGIGGLRLTRSFFEIYMREAAQHAATLEAQCAEWRRRVGSEAPHAFVRAAHTLASSSRTVGFGQVAELAEALEQWMPHAPRTPAADAGMVQVAVANLRAMAEALARRESPPAAPALVQGLHELVRRLRAPAQAEPERAPVAPSAAHEPAGRDKRALRDDIDAQLLPIFLEEAQQLMPVIGGEMRDWKADPQDQRAMQALQRALHTLKGSARMAGAIRLGELTHLMETRIEQAAEAGACDAALFGELEDKLDRLNIDLERMATGAEPAGAPQAREAPAQAARAEPPLPGPAAMLRINADTLDHLINDSGEVSIARARIEGELRAVKHSIGDLSESIARLRAQLREVEVQADSQMQSRLSVVEERDREFDPLEFDRYTRLQELTRLMAESLHDAASIQQALLRSLGETDAALTQQARTSRDLQQELMRMRAVPFSVLDERLYRIVRQTARELGKQAELEIQGSQVELDRSVLERIGAPLEHMLRNALAHGIESPEARAAAGKPPGGRIRVQLRQESNEIVLTVSDDGAGIALERLRRRAEERGLLAPQAAEDPAALAQLIFTSGLSTAETVTELAGRGIGMDVVRNEVTAIGGRVEVATRAGEGTTFTIYLPLTLAVTQAVLVRAGASVLAVPSAMVEQVLRLKSGALADLYAAGEVQFQERAYPLFGLAQLLGTDAAASQLGTHSVLLVRSGAQRIALHVDELVGNQEVVVKGIGPQLARVPGVAGATVLADGAIALIVNPVALAQRGRAAGAAGPAQMPQVSVQPVVMVVDDSLTVRKATGRLLEREGYQVITAKDGVDALEQMKNVLPSILLVDIEMPRMDGFDLARHVRSDPVTRHLPIVVISSRTADKHRNQAAQLGVNAFLGKPYSEADLLRHIAELIAPGSHAAAA
jgi:chemosensory pili system protein ChpA (sensor histidine kinase/response regulator)